MTTDALQSIKLPTSLLERASAIADEWNERDGVTMWTRANVIRYVLTHGFGLAQKVVDSTTSRPPGDHRGSRKVVNTTTSDHQAHKETRAPARKRTRTAASAGGNKNTSLSPEPTSGAAPQPPPDRVHQENQAPATPARDAHTHARNESSVTTPVGAAGGPRTGAEVQFIPPPPSPEEDAEIIAKAQARCLVMRAQVEADEAAAKAKRVQAGIEHRAKLEAERARMDAYYAAHPEGRGAPL